MEKSKQTPEDIRQQKFNMDLAFQQQLHETFLKLSFTKLGGNLSLSFQLLKQIMFMLQYGVPKDEFKKTKEVYEELTILNQNLNGLLSKYQIHYSEDKGCYAYSRSANSSMARAERTPPELVIVQTNLLLKLDIFEQCLRQLMVKMGMYHLKAESGLDATG